MHILTHIQRVKDGTIIDKNILAFVKSQQPAERKDGNQRRYAPVTERHGDQAPAHITLG